MRVAVDRGLDRFKVTIADITPDEVVQGVGVEVVLVATESPVDRVECLGQASQDPPIGESDSLGVGADIDRVDVRTKLGVDPAEHKSSGIPNLVGEVAAQVEFG